MSLLHKLAKGDSLDHIRLRQDCANLSDVFPLFQIAILCSERHPSTNTVTASDIRRIQRHHAGPLMLQVLVKGVCALDSLPFGL
jgi:hypothetical protein